MKAKVVIDGGTTSAGELWKIWESEDGFFYRVRKADRRKSCGPFDSVELAREAMALQLEQPEAAP